MPKNNISNVKITISAILMAIAIAPNDNASADSVAQVQTAKRIAETTVQLIDPQGGGSTGGAGGTVNYAIGDILTFNIRFTPVENGATRGLGGYITEYIPNNTEVVGARFVNGAGETVCPHRGGFGPIGVGDRGVGDYSPADFPNGISPGEGGLSALYADTGIFYSVDPRTARAPTGDFTTVSNGVTMTCDPTGVGQLEDLVGAAGNPNNDHFAHNQWDNIQLQAFGCDTTGFRMDLQGEGNTPFGYGSAVAGPDTFYKFEATETNGIIGLTNQMGPWQRIKTPCAETGTGVAATGVGPGARVGVPTDVGHQLSPDAPLPSMTNALRFAVGELAVGQEYQVEVSLRVLASPLDSLQNGDTNCSEVFGGDASSRSLDGASGGKDNTWRYFLPAPACVDLGLLFNLDVDKLQILSGETITYTLRTKNLSTFTHNNVSIQTDLAAGVGMVANILPSNGGVVAGSVVTWPAISLIPGEEVIYTITADGVGNASPLLTRGTFISNELPSPGFSVVSLTNLGPIALPILSMSVAPESTTNGGTVTYTATVVNQGSGDADLSCPDCGFTVELPSGVTIIPGTATIDGITVGTPTANGTTYTFDRTFFSGALSTIIPGASRLLVFDALIGNGVLPGVYGSRFDTWIDDPAQREMSDSINNVARIFVDVVQSDVPVVNSPIFQDSVMVCGTSTEVDGTAITVSVNLLPAGTTTVTSGMWCSSVPTLIAGQNVSATATASGEVESAMSVSVTVSGITGTIPACNDGIDNDNDGLTDLADPGCTDAADLDETDVTECSNQIDDDGNGLIDFPDDISCSSYADNDESGVGACADGVDNDGDGDIDLADSGCDDANDTSEVDIPLCANGIDDDNDNLVDYPEDPGCESSVDNDESLGNINPPDAGPMDDAGVVDTSDAGVGADAGTPADPGGISDPSGGCGCNTSSPASNLGSLLFALLALVAMRRRKNWLSR